jgi:hypothetical protein
VSLGAGEGGPWLVEDEQEIPDPNFSGMGVSPLYGRERGRARAPDFLLFTGPGQGLATGLPARPGVPSLVGLPFLPYLRPAPYRLAVAPAPVSCACVCMCVCLHACACVRACVCVCVCVRAWQ